MDLRVCRLWRFLCLRFGEPRLETYDLEGEMGLLDKLLGRGKKAAGDVIGDSSLRQEGAAQERAGAAEDRAAQHEDLAQEQRNQAAQARTEQEQS
jgi:uncharacterized protein YjbJ (UPF0337 family)